MGIPKSPTKSVLKSSLVKDHIPEIPLSTPKDPQGPSRQGEPLLWIRAPLVGSNAQGLEGQRAAFDGHFRVCGNPTEPGDDQNSAKMAA